jgi:TolB protein
MQVEYKYFRAGKKSSDAIATNERAPRVSTVRRRLGARAIVAAGSLLFAACLLSLGFPRTAEADGADAGAGTPLPTATDNGGVTQVFVSGGTRSLFKVAIAPTVGDPAVSNTVIETTSRDFQLSSMFQVLDPKSFTANLEKEGIAIDPASWRNVGAEGVIKGSSTPRGQGIHLELRLYVVSRGADAVLKKEYDIGPSGVRGAVHEFVNEVIKWFTGAPGSFGSRLVFSATTGRGQKSIFSIDSDGQSVAKLPTVSNVSLAPAVGPGGSVYYAGGLPDGTYSLFKIGNPAAVIKQAGLVFGVAFGGSKMALVVSQGGQSDIFVGAPDGSGLTKVTRGGLNTHPAFGPGGQLAYVSNVSGNPQIYVDGKRVSWRGNYNMAPVFCNDPEGTKILFMGRDGGNWDIFNVDPGGSAASMKRLTQEQGSNTYPACSPDGRMVAFFSTRGGLFTSNSQGQNQQKISAVSGESLRWEGN